MSDTPPCKNCVCVPVCRHKHFGDLYHDCQLVQMYFRDTNIDGRQYWNLRYALKSTGWTVSHTNNRRPVNIYDEGQTSDSPSK